MWSVKNRLKTKIPLARRKPEIKSLMKDVRFCYVEKVADKQREKELKLAPRLTEKHIKPSKYQKMRVGLASGPGGRRRAKFNISRKRMEANAIRYGADNNVDSFMLTLY
ncbi:uncharacterized protein LOC144431305 [Styela clava]